MQSKRTVSHRSNNPSTRALAPRCSLIFSPSNLPCAQQRRGSGARSAPLVLLHPHYTAIPVPVAQAARVTAAPLLGAGSPRAGSGVGALPRGAGASLEPAASSANSTPFVRDAHADRAPESHVDAQVLTCLLPREPRADSYPTSLRGPFRDVRPLNRRVTPASHTRRGAYQLAPVGAVPGRRQMMLKKWKNAWTGGSLIDDIDAQLDPHPFVTLPLHSTFPCGRSRPCWGNHA